MQTKNLIFGFIKAIFCMWFVCMSNVVNADNENSDCYFEHDGIQYYFNWCACADPQRISEKFKQQISVGLKSPGEVLLSTATTVDHGMLPNYNRVQLTNGHLSWAQSNNYDAGKTGWAFSSNGELWDIHYNRKSIKNVKCAVSYTDARTGAMHTVGKIDVGEFGMFNLREMAGSCSCM